MSSNAVNFIRKHPLMETSASPSHKRPSLTTVGAKHRLTAIAVDPQVPTISGNEAFDVIYVGTDDGRVIKFFNYEAGDVYKTVIISDVQVLPPGTRITELTISRKTDALLVVSDGAIVTTALNYCRNMTTCDDCARIPGCAWHVEAHECVAMREKVDSRSIKKYLQDPRATETKYCKKFGAGGSGRAEPAPPSVITSPVRGTVSGVGHVPVHPSGDENEITVTSLNDRDFLTNGLGGPWASDNEYEAANQLNTYTAQTMASSVVLTSIASLVVGLVVGIYLSRRRCHKNPFLDSEQRNHLNW